MKQLRRFSVGYSPAVFKTLKKIDRGTAALIYIWINEHLQNCENPRQYGKPLTSNRKGAWRYRIGKYRLLANIQDEHLTILLIDLGDRKNIYR